MKKLALLYEELESAALRCNLCNHRCVIKPDAYGFCGVRQNIGGKLYTYAYGEVIANHVDPIEKKPLYHFLPGSFAYSIATIGCNFRCGFCQNWQISQASSRGGDFPGYELKPEDVVREAKKHRCKSISYTYTEPTVFFEYALETAKIAKEEGLFNSFVTNGFMTKEALDIIRPYLDAANVDLKSFSDDTYKKVCHGRLEPVLDSIRYMKKLGIWVEVTTLVVPGLNDSDKELQAIAEFIAATGLEMPWHISRFHPDYKYTDKQPTQVDLLKKAAQIGKKAGLHHVYLGNVAEDANTYCRNCGELLISRGFLYTTESRLDVNKCPKCGTVLDGIFPQPA